MHLGILLALLVATAGPATAGEAHAHGHAGRGGSHGNPSDLDRYIASLTDPARDAWQEPDALLAAFALRPGEVACDVGAGPGYFTLRLARLVGPFGRVYAVDVEPRILQALVERLGSAHDIAAGPDGNLWFTEYNSGKIGRITTSGAAVEFALPQFAGVPNPKGIAAGADGNLWFTETTGNRIGRITTTGTISEFSLPFGSDPYAIAAGADGNLWFTAYLGNRIGRISPRGAVTTFPIPSAGSFPTALRRARMDYSGSQRTPRIESAASLKSPASASSATAPRRFYVTLPGLHRSSGRVHKTGDLEGRREWRA
jgi:sugar lactone lactonase YvrE